MRSKTRTEKDLKKTRKAGAPFQKSNEKQGKARKAKEVIEKQGKARKAVEEYPKRFPKREPKQQIYRQALKGVEHAKHNKPVKPTRPGSLRLTIVSCTPFPLSSEPPTHRPTH